MSTDSGPRVAIARNRGSMGRGGTMAAVADPRPPRFEAWCSTSNRPTTGLLGNTGSVAAHGAVTGGRGAPSHHRWPQPSATNPSNQAPPERELLSESGDLWRGRTGLEPAPKSRN
jgi:hypothetical protein